MAWIREAGAHSNYAQVHSLTAMLIRACSNLLTPTTHIDIFRRS